ncbi:Uncharacterised protein [Mycobacteroides abscessus subsp. abscessus]|uniref:DUF1922 domain-containing protein n=1 Tax=Mycobacteroides abscessus TaxID=36809 RepID=UPI0009298BCE|nr:DUF1922 domain-containing protein [Mycobacteroides abscessus]SHY98595.1 Uncharacterised protein [Mycobacteroides abscessus subsp. abscessus]SIH30042.1 Uncharacterised protein [Mycobacteroides abscessus subsp. abscessus]SKN43242.1 Uncharacterised protein [Mycobacteroides abscessus subsp. abscessus]SLB69846.1 Uncharacterised protein [Mycobacteroides abscessus subsp. abscessus]
MPTECRNKACKRASELYLCNDCTTVLRNMLDQVPALLDELDARIQKLDRVPHGTIGRTRGPSDLNVMDFDAVETARETRKMLRSWVETVAEQHSGRRPPGLDTVETRSFARWLQVNAEAIARLEIAGKIYDDIKKLVGSDQRGGQLVRAIDRRERHFAGACPTITGWDAHGHVIECGEILYDEYGDRTIDCPTCGQEIDVKRNQVKALATRDLMPSDALLEALENAGETIEAEQIERWIAIKRLRPRGYMHQGKFVKTRVQEADNALYSFEAARRILRKDNRHNARRKEAVK